MSKFLWNALRVAMVVNILSAIFIVFVPPGKALEVFGELEGALLELLSSDPGSGDEGRIYWNTSEKKAKVYNGTQWTALGSGAGGGSINYISSPDSAIDWTNGGTGIVASTTSTASEFPRQGYDTQALKLVNENSGTAGQSFCFQIGESDKNKVIEFSWAQRVDGTLYETGDFEFYIVSDTAADCSGTETAVRLLEHDTTDPVPLQAINGTMDERIVTDDSDYYQLYIVRDSSAGTDSGWVTLSSITVGPKGNPPAYAGGHPEAFTPTWTGATNIASQGWWYQRHGNWAHVWGSTTLSGAVGGTISLGLPFTIDTSLIQNTTAGYEIRGKATGVDVGTAFRVGNVAYNSSTSVGFTREGASLWNATVPHTWASTDVISADFWVPVSGWDVGAYQIDNHNSQAPQIRYLASDLTSDTADIASLKITGIVPNRQYRLTMTAKHNLTGSSGGQGSNLQAKDGVGGTILSENRFTVDGSTNSHVSYQTTVALITPTTSIISFDWDETGTATLHATDATTVETMVILEPWPNGGAGVYGSLATPTNPGLVQKNKWQAKVLASDVSSPGTLSDLTFNNLVVGKHYRATIHAEVEVAGTTATEVGVISVTHDGNSIARLGLRSDGQTDTSHIRAVSSTIFAATATSLTFVYSETGTASINGNNTLAETHAILEELNNYEVTTDF